VDEAVFRALYSETVIPLRAYVVRTLGGMSYADDIVQEAYLRALRRPLQGSDVKEWRAYLFRIAGNLLIDHWRRYRREVDVADIGEPTVRDRDAAARLDISRMFQKLRPRERQLLWLAYVEKADHEEIAAALGLRVRSVKVVLSRARHKLARLLRGGGHHRIGAGDVETAPGQ
jgi:RNA polymerase sigma-70 factor (ECF subfamily)